MDHVSARELLGVYALDACEEDETDAVEAHIAGCDECETEAARLREVAGWIGSYRRLWDKRFDQIDTIIANARKETP